LTAQLEPACSSRNGGFGFTTEAALVNGLVEAEQNNAGG
jgi:hypothetical protein